MSREERMRILSLLEEGNISAAEAARLLEAMAPAPGTPVAPAPGGGKVHVRVTDTATGATRLRLTLPAALARIGARLAAATEVSDELTAAGISAADLKRVREAIDSGTAGTILDLDDGTAGYRVEVWIE